MMPNSARCARKAACVRCRTRRGRVFSTIAAACCSAVLIGTKCMVFWDHRFADGSARRHPSATRSWASDVKSLSFNSSSRSRPLMGKTAPLSHPRRYAGDLCTANRSTSSWNSRQLTRILSKHVFYVHAVDAKGQVTGRLRLRPARSFPSSPRSHPRSWDRGLRYRALLGTRDSAVWT